MSGDRPSSDEDFCVVVVGEQWGEPVVCGAVQRVHGAALGMVTHPFVGVAERPTERVACAGRAAVAHPRTLMVDGVCQVCGEPE